MKYNMTEFKTVEDVVRSDFCMGCGMCSVVCPTEAIQMRYNESMGQNIPLISEDKCINCGKCLKVCSGWQVDHALLTVQKFGKLPENPFLGNYTEILSAWSDDENIRRAGASGGFVTQLLLNLLEKGVIDAALIVHSGKESAFEPEVLLARSRESLVSGQRSCYLNAPVCMGLREVLKEKLKVALVGLPCQINSILKSLDLLPELQARIVFTIGLFCNGVYKTRAVTDFLESVGIEKSQVKKVDFRYGDWPGKMRICMADGEEKLYKRDAFFAVNYLKRCYFCNDFLADKADISVGDNWAEKDVKGKNLIIVRNGEIKRYFHNIVSEPFLEVDLFETHRLYHSRRRYTKSLQKQAKISGEKYPDIKPAIDLPVKSWNRLVAWLDWQRIRYGGSDKIIMRRLFLKLRGTLLSNFIYPIPVPDIYLAEAKPYPVILITEGDVVGNKGAVAMVECIIRDIKAQFPQADFVVTSRKIKKNVKYKVGVSTLYVDGPVYELALLRVGCWWILQKLGIRLNSLLENNIINAYQKADIVISATGISFIDDFGYRRIYYFSRYLLLPLLLGKKLIKFTQSFGPINSKYNRLMTRKLLPLAQVVMARGRHSVENLKKAGVFDNVLAFPDIALTMEPVFSEKVESTVKTVGGYIGLSPNSVCRELSDYNYIKTLKRLVSFISSDLPDTKILFIPHTISNDKLGRKDDLSICRQLAELMPEGRSKIADTLAMSPGELKALIGRAEFFVGSRYHSLVAAVSMAIPCLAIGWHWKYNELMEWFGLDDNIINIWELGQEDAVERFTRLYNGRAKRRIFLEKTSIELKKQAAEATGYIISELKK